VVDNLVISDVHTLPGVVLCESGLASVVVLVVVALLWEEAGEKVSVLETRGPECLTELLTPPGAAPVSTATAHCGPGKPLQQERRDRMELSSSSSMCGQEGTWGPYPGTACQDRACLAGDGEGPVGAPPWEPRSTGPREAPAWACTAGRKLPSCLRG